MLLIRIGAAICLSALLIAGCGGKPAADQVVGKWYGKVSAEKGTTNPDGYDVADIAPVTLELTPKGTFTLMLMGVPLTGSYSVEGDKVKLLTETFQGQRIEDSPFADALKELKQPMIAKLRDGGKTLSLVAQTFQPAPADLTFSRTPPAEESVGKKTVTPAEAKLVGNYVYDLGYTPPASPVDPKDKRAVSRRKAREMVQNLAKNSRLSLRADNTFVMELMYNIKGTWRLKGNEITMTATEPKAMVDNAAMHGDKPEFWARLSKTTSQLLMVNDKSKEVDYAMRRE